MLLLRQIANRQRPKPEDVAWISNEASYCWTGELQQAWHRIEAEAFSIAWENTGDPWDAVNASGHWRKAGKADIALVITGSALSKPNQKPRVRSALATTRGGAMRDADRLTDAKALGLEAHDLTPSDFRPCTLLGAVHLELGDLEAGHKWYQKAETLGAGRLAVDQELRALMARLDPIQRQRIRAFLLGQDAVRFAWLRT